MNMNAYFYLSYNVVYFLVVMCIIKFSCVMFQDVGNIAFEKVCPEMTPADFEKFIEPVVMEYFEHGDSKDVLVSPVFALVFWVFHCDAHRQV